MKQWIGSAALIATVSLAGSACSDKAAPGAASASAKGATSAAVSAKPAGSASSATPPKTPPAVTGSASAAAPAKPRPSAKPVAHDQLDKKPDAAAAKLEGEWITIPHTTGTFHVPKAWKKAEGTNPDWVAYGSADEKAGFIATTYAKGEDPTGKLGAVSTGLGFTDCVWSNPQDATVGAEDFASKVADGVCQQGDTWVYVVYAMISGSDLNVFVIGGWDDGAPDAEQEELLAIFRSLKNKK